MSTIIGGSGNPTTLTIGGANTTTTTLNGTTLILGSATTTTTTLNGTVVTTKLTTPVLDADAVSTAMTLGSNLTSGSLAIGGSVGHTGNISIGAGQTSGVLNIGTGTRVTTGNGGAINIGTGTRTAEINIGTGAGSTGPINIGVTGGTTTINGITKLDANAVSTAMTLGSNLTSGSLAIGGSVGHTGNISIGAGQTTGVLNIATTARTKSNGTQEGNINIGTGNNTITSGTTAPTINLGNNVASTNLTEISVGATNTKTTINGTLTTSLGTIAGKTAQIDVDTTTFPAALTTATNMEVVITLYGTGASGTYTIPIGFPNLQILIFKNWSNLSHTLTFPAGTFYPYTAASGGGGITSIAIPAGDAFKVQYLSSKWFQITPSNSFNSITSTSIASGSTLGVLSSGNMSIGSTNGTMGITCGGALTLASTNTGVVNIGISGSSQIYIGASGFTTTVNGPLASQIGILSGSIAYESTGATAYTIPNTINRDYYLLVLLASGTSTITMPTLKVNQIVHIRVFNSAGTAITVKVPTSTTGSFYPNGTNASFSLIWNAFPAGTTQNFYCTGADWVGF